MNGGAVQIVYDAFGERVAKSVNGVVTRYLVEDDVNPTGIPQVFDELTNGVVTRTYAYGLQRIDEEQVLNGAWTPSFYGYDGGGSVRQLTDYNGNPTDTYEYDAYGNSFTKSGITPNNFLYRGEQFDPDLGLYYLRARYYNPASGMFYSRDPKDGRRTNPQSLHKYLYTNGDPVNGIDPMGREDEAECAAVSAAGGCAALPVTTGIPTAMMTAEAEGAETAAEAALEGEEIVEEEGAEVAGEEVEEEKLADEVETDCSKFGVKPATFAEKITSLIFNVTDEHHMVAQGAEDLLKTRIALGNIGFAINSAMNLVTLPMLYHSHLHTQTYYDYVKELINNALGKEGNQMANVEEKLNELSGELKTCAEQYVQ